MPVQPPSLLYRLARFTAVGALGFLVDSGVLYAGLAVGLNLYSGRLASFLAAASFTWYLNRRFTFQSTTNRYVKEWSRYLLANTLGGVANLGVYALLVAKMAVVAAMPVLAVAAGSATGLIFNFALSQTLVFGRQRNV
jgi:putative flippase GtrA